LADQPYHAGADGWLVAAAAVVGSPEDPEFVYAWDRTLSPAYEAAVFDGFDTFGSDDFNTGRVEAGVLVWWGWMRERHPDEDRRDAADALGIPHTRPGAPGA